MHNYINVCVQNSITPLHVAAKWGRKGMVALLLDTGATIDARTRVIVFVLSLRHAVAFFLLGVDFTVMTMAMLMTAFVSIVTVGSKRSNKARKRGTASPTFSGKGIHYFFFQNYTPIRSTHKSGHI